jgi:hypothetical protein
MGELFDDEDRTTPESWPMLARATPADRLARFGCGGILAGLVSAAIVAYGGLDLLGATGAGVTAVVVVGVLFIGACAVLSAAYGDRFLRALLKLLEWL